LSQIHISLNETGRLAFWNTKTWVLALELIYKVNLKTVRRYSLDALGRCYPMIYPLLNGVLLLSLLAENGSVATDESLPAAKGSPTGEQSASAKCGNC
jgi:hypothetical protein